MAAWSPRRGYFQRVREICDRHGVLLVSDEVICAFGRLGDWFGASRLGYQPDMLTFAKGVTSGYAPLGGVLVSDRLAEPFLTAGTSFLHGITFGGHPVSCAVALANLDVMAREDLPGRVLGLEDEFRAALDGLTDLPIVREVRGMGYFYGIELTKNGTDFSDDECDWLIRGFLSNRLLELGPDLPCRRPGRPGHPALPVARRRARGVRRHRGDPPPGAAGGVEGARPGDPLRGRPHGGQGGRAPGGPDAGRRARDGVARREVLVQAGAGLGASIPDEAYAKPAPRSSPTPPSCGRGPGWSSR